MNDDLLLDQITRLMERLHLSDRDEVRMVMNPWIYNGGWMVQRTKWSWRNPIFAPMFKWLGRKLKSRRIYWLGWPVEWFEGWAKMASARGGVKIELDPDLATDQVYVLKRGEEIDGISLDHRDKHPGISGRVAVDRHVEEVSADDEDRGSQKRPKGQDMSKDKIEYQVIEAHDAVTLQKWVNNELAAGYEPWGDLIIKPVEDGADGYVIYAQAMIRRTFCMRKMSEEREASNVSQG